MLLSLVAHAVAPTPVLSATDVCDACGACGGGGDGPGCLPQLLHPGPLPRIPRFHHTQGPHTVGVTTLPPSSCCIASTD